MKRVNPLINFNKWEEVLTEKEYAQLFELVRSIISSATDRKYNYSDIMLALYKNIQIIAFEYQVETAL